MTRAGAAGILGPWEFHTDKWELAYIRRIDAPLLRSRAPGFR